MSLLQTLSRAVMSRKQASTQPDAAVADGQNGIFDQAEKVEVSSAPRTAISILAAHKTLINRFAIGWSFLGVLAPSVSDVMAAVYFVVAVVLIAAVVVCRKAA